VPQLQLQLQNLTPIDLALRNLPETSAAERSLVTNYAEVRVGYDCVVDHRIKQPTVINVTKYHSITKPFTLSNCYHTMLFDNVHRQQILTYDSA